MKIVIIGGGIIGGAIAFPQQRLNLVCIKPQMFLH